MRNHVRLLRSSFFFFNDTATTEIYTLSLHDALPISGSWSVPPRATGNAIGALDPHHIALVSAQAQFGRTEQAIHDVRSEEHTSELQSPCNLVCRLLLEKKKKTKYKTQKVKYNQYSSTIYYSR